MCLLELTRMAVLQLKKREMRVVNVVNRVTAKRLEKNSIAEMF